MTNFKGARCKFEFEVLRCCWDNGSKRIDRLGTTGNEERFGRGPSRGGCTRFCGNRRKRRTTKTDARLTGSSGWGRAKRWLGHGFCIRQNSSTRSSLTTIKWRPGNGTSFDRCQNPVPADDNSARFSAWEKIGNYFLSYREWFSLASPKRCCWLRVHISLMGLETSKLRNNYIRERSILSFKADVTLK